MSLWRRLDGARLGHTARAAEAPHVLGRHDSTQHDAALFGVYLAVEVMTLYDDSLHPVRKSN